MTPGRRIGPYEILAPLGSGGMGEVYRARDTRLGRDVALKVLPEAFSSHPERLARFQREAETLAALNHPHIAAIYGFEQSEETSALCLELVEGPTLAERMETGPLPVAEALRIGAQVADALHAAHRRGIVHRDLKPANVKLTVDGEVKVLDFGLAKSFEVTPVVSQEQTLVVTRLGMVVGTAAYMAPEQAAGAEVDPRADIWSLGVLLYEMVTGRRAFPGNSAQAVLSAVMRAEIDWSALPSRLPVAMLDILHRSIDPDPAKRPVDAAEVQTALIAAAASSSGTTGSSVADNIERSIVVLPFANVSPDPENEYFSDGLTEEVIADLSKVTALRVISRTTAMRLKGTDTDLQTLSRKLGVGYALEGSVRKAGTNLRITAQLVDIASDRPLWSEKYKGTLEDVFDIQERVSRAIVDALRVQLSVEEEVRLGARPHGSGSGYDTFLRARRDIMTFSLKLIDRAVADLERELSAHPNDLFLLRGMGMAEWQYVNAGHSADLTHLDRAESYARRVLELDPDGPHGHTLLGYLAIQRGNRRDWVRHFSRALDHDPRDPDALAWLALAWVWGGFPERGRPLLERLESIDPLFDFLYWARGCVDVFEGRFLEGANCFRRAAELTPEMIGWPVVTIQALLMAGDIPAATSALEKVAPDLLEHPLRKLGVTLLRAAQGERDEALDDETFLDQMWNDLQYSWFVAQSYALLADREPAMRWLRQSVERGFINYPFLSERDPLLVNLRDLPEFHKLMEFVKNRWETFEATIENSEV